MKEDLRRSSSYGTELFGFMLKRGCNGIPGSLAKVDKCNVCGGDGRSCVGCDGRPYSGEFNVKCINNSTVYYIRVHVAFVL